MIYESHWWVTVEVTHRLVHEDSTMTNFYNRSERAMAARRCSKNVCSWKPPFSSILASPGFLRPRPPVLYGKPAQLNLFPWSKQTWGIVHCLKLGPKSCLQKGWFDKIQTSMHKKNWRVSINYDFFSWFSSHYTICTKALMFDRRLKYEPSN